MNESRNVRDTPYRHTKVSVDKSQTDVRQFLRKYEVEDIQFTYRRNAGIQVVFARQDQVGHMNSYRVRSQPLTPDEQGDRQAMRMVFHWLKAMLETIEFGIADFETAMLPYQLVSGQEGPATVGEIVLDQIQAGGTVIDPFRPALPAPRET